MMVRLFEPRGGAGSWLTARRSVIEASTLHTPIQYASIIRQLVYTGPVVNGIVITVRQ